MFQNPQFNSLYLHIFMCFRTPSSAPCPLMWSLCVYVNYLCDFVFQHPQFSSLSTCVIFVCLHKWSMLSLCVYINDLSMWSLCVYINDLSMWSLCVYINDLSMWSLCVYINDLSMWSLCVYINDLSMWSLCVYINDLSMWSLCVSEPPVQLPVHLCDLCSLAATSSQPVGPWPSLPCPLDQTVSSSWSLISNLHQCMQSC